MFQNGPALGKNVMGTMRIERKTWEVFICSVFHSVSTALKGNVASCCFTFLFALLLE